ncbi:MAG: hypothetical protein NTY30_01120 [Candidatus Berkelbacteria bacterium]|nr:hypothetical protein [Candidatus Berkelbacteria bacterium]
MFSETNPNSESEIGESPEEMKKRRLAELREEGQNGGTVDHDADRQVRLVEHNKEVQTEFLNNHPELIRKQKPTSEE